MGGRKGWQPVVNPTDQGVRMQALARHPHARGGFDRDDLKTPSPQPGRIAPGSCADVEGQPFRPFRQAVEELGVDRLRVELLILVHKDGGAFIISANRIGHFQPGPPVSRPV